MALNNLIPIIWAARLLFNLNNAHVFAQESVINRDYEGDIQNMGDTVRINGIGRVTIFDYTKNSDMPTAETLDDASQSLLIDHSKGFNLFVDDIDKAQQKPKIIDDAMQEASWGLRDVVDTYLAGLYTEVASGNFIGSDGSPKTISTASEAYEYLVDLGTMLSDNNVPQDGRWVAVPNWFHGLLLKDARFVSYGTGENRNVLESGVVGRAAGFNILLSNNISNVAGAKYKIMAGHKIGWSFAEQIVKVESYRPERRFGDAVKGLHVWGAKVTRPNTFGVLVATKG